MVVSEGAARKYLSDLRGFSVFGGEMDVNQADYDTNSPWPTGGPIATPSDGDSMNTYPPVVMPSVPDNSGGSGIDWSAIGSGIKDLLPTGIGVIKQLTGNGGATTYVPPTGAPPIKNYQPGGAPAAPMGTATKVGLGLGALAVGLIVLKAMKK